LSLVKIDSYTPFPVSGPDFSDDFSSDNMTDVGSGVGVSGGKLQFISAVGGDNRAWESMGITLNDTAFVARCGYLMASTTTVNGVPTYPLLFSDSSSDPISVDSAIYMNDTSRNSYCTSYNGASSGALSTPAISITHDTQYYVELIRSSSTVLDLGIFSDSGFSTDIIGSPETVAISSSTIDLDTFQAAVKSNQAGGNIDAEVTDVNVWNGVTAPP
jgi:hypothetical protein